MKSRQKYVLYALLFLLLWAGCVAFRYKTGAHYLPVHVQVAAGKGDDLDLVVVTRSPWGSVAILQRDEHDRQLWRRKDYVVSPVSSVVVACDSDRSPAGVTLVLGASRDWTTQEFKVLNPGLRTSVPAGVMAKYAYEFRPERLATSVTSTASQTVNYQGDGSLLFVCGLQALVVCACLHFLRFAVSSCLHRRSESGETILKWGGLPVAMRYLVSFLFFCVVSVLAIQFIINFDAGFSVSDVTQFSFGLAISSLLIGSYLIYASISLRIRPDSVQCGFAFIITFLVLKVIWVLCTTHFSSGDYGTYLKYGRLMANGQWDKFPSSFYLTEAMLKRSVFYTFPLAWLEQYATTAIPLGNCIIQAATLLVYFFYCRRCFDNQVATISLPFVAAYPDCLFATPMASHDIPGMFSLLIFFALVDVLRVHVARCYSRACYLRVALLSTLLGIVAAAMDFQRGYFPLIAVATIAFCGFLLVYKGSSVRSMLFDRRIIVSAAGVLICFCVTNMVTKNATALIREMAAIQLDGNDYGIAAYVSASRTNDSDDWRSMTPWCYVYFPRVPDRNRSEVIRRKLLHEKLASQASLWPYVWKKCSVVAGSHNYVEKAGAQVDGEMFPSIFYVPWFSAKLLFCCLVMSSLMLLTLLRLLMVASLPIQIGEVFPFCFCISSMAVILLLGEAAAQYDIFLAFPLAWCSGLVVRMLLDPQKGPTSVPTDHGSTVNAFLIGGALFAAVVAIHYAAGAYVDSAAWTFDRPVVLSKDDHAASGEWATSEISDASAFLSIPQSTVPPVGTKVSASFMTTHSYSDGQRIRFFVTGDQQRKKIWLDSEWVSYPVTFSVAVNGSEVAKGSLGELSKPLFIDQPLLNAKDRPAVISTTLVTEGVWSEGVPSIGIEYIH